MAAGPGLFPEFFWAFAIFQLHFALPFTEIPSNYVPMGKIRWNEWFFSHFHGTNKVQQYKYTPI